MTTEAFIANLEKLLKQEYPDANISRISDDNSIGCDIDDDTWFIEVQEG